MAGHGGRFQSGAGRIRGSRSGKEFGKVSHQTETGATNGLGVSIIAMLVSHGKATKGVLMIKVVLLRLLLLVSILKGIPIIIVVVVAAVQQVGECTQINSGQIQSSRVSTGIGQEVLGLRLETWHLHRGTGSVIVVDTSTVVVQVKELGGNGRVNAGKLKCRQRGHSGP